MREKNIFAFGKSVCAVCAAVCRCVPLLREGNFPVEYEKNLLKHRKHSYITYIIDHHHMPTCMCPTSVQRVKTCMFSTNYCVNWLHAHATSLQPKKCCKLVAYWSLQATAHLQRCIRNVHLPGTGVAAVAWGAKGRPQARAGPQAAHPHYMSGGQPCWRTARPA